MNLNNKYPNINRCLFLFNTLLALVLLVLSSNATAQQELRFRRIDVEDGLPHNTVLSILQDRKGFMWFATQDGLCRYDGYAFTIFRHDLTDSTSLSSNKIMSIMEDREGYIWVGTQGTGLNRFDPKTETFTRYCIDSAKVGCQDNFWVSELLEDHQGDIWGTTFGEGLFRYDKKQDSFERFTYQADNPNSISNNDLNSMAIDREGNIWIGAVGGLNRFNPRTRTFKQYLNGLDEGYDFSNEFLSKLFFDKTGRLWLGTYGHGILQFDPESETVTKYLHNPTDPKSISNDFNFHKGMYEDKTGRIWISTMGGGLNIFDPASNTFSHYKNDPTNEFSISNNIVAAIYEDNHGNIWLGGEGGLSITTSFENRFSLYQHLPDKPNGLSHNNITCLLEDRESMIWVGTNSGGLNSYDRNTNTFKTYRHDPKNNNSISSDFIQSVMEDSKGNLWVGTDGGGPNLFDRKTETFTRFYNDTYWQMLNDIHTIFEDDSGEYWLGTHGGLFSFNPKNRESIPYLHDPHNPQSISNDVIGRIFQDSRGDVWVSTWMGGLNRMNPKKLGEAPSFKRFQHDPKDSQSLSSNEVSLLFEDSKGTLWVGTSDGLNQYDPESSTFRRYGKEAGFPSTFFYGILEDDIGNLWLSTGNGLCRFNPQTGALKVYDAKDGLQSNNFSGQFQLGAHCKSRTGELFFGGPNGFNSFFPDSIQENNHVPPVAITGFNVFNKPVKLQKPISELRSIEIPYSDNVLSFDFAALDFRNTAKNLYSYQLVGFDKDWVHGGTRHFATYTNLPPNTYTFRVKGSNNDGVWNEQGASIQLIILPPWWQTWWAYTLYALLALAAILSLRHYEMKRFKLRQRAEHLAELDTLKTRFFTNISHEFRTPLTLILGNLQKFIARTSEDNQDKPIFQMMQRNAQRLLELINQLLDLSKLEAGSLKLETKPADIISFLKAIMLSFNSLAELKKIRYHLYYSNKIQFVYFDPDKLEKIVVNLLSNAFKFTPEGGEISVRTRLLSISNQVFIGNFKKTGSSSGKSILEIKVEDNGKGMDQKHLDRIFDRFYQIDNSQTREQEGTGIGLSLIKELVELHQGEISVESQLGRGSCFTVKIPLLLADYEEVVGPGFENNGQKTKPDLSFFDTKIDFYPDHKIDTLLKEAPMILIVEDNADLRYYIRETLQPFYHILEAADGKEGFNIAVDSIPDLILSDVMMPKLNGIDLCRKLKNNEKTAHIPIVLLTARASGEDKYEGLVTGADDYLTKPFEASELLIRIKNLIESRKKLREHFSREITLQPASIPITSVDEKFLQRAMQIIESHISDPSFGVETFSREVAMSRMQLFRKLKALTNYSPGDFIRIMRLKRAAELLSHGAGTIAEVAFMVGYNEPSYFTKSFQKEFGKTPSEFISTSSLKN